MSNKKEYKPGDIVTVSGIEFVILDRIEGATAEGHGYLAMTLHSQFRSPFDEGGCNNYTQSDLRNRVDEWLDEADIDTDFIIARDVDLMTLDGYKGYGVVSVLAAPLTLDERRKYAEIIPNPDEAEWLATGWGGPGKIGTYHVWYVSTSGGYDGHGAYSTCGVRPALILDPVLLASGEDEDENEVDLRGVSSGRLLAELASRIDPARWGGEKAAEGNEEAPA